MKKTDILSLLREADGFVSGQDLSERLQVSRTAVWKKIRQLEQEGYMIEAVRNRGYRLVSSPRDLGAAEVESRLTTKWAGRPVCWLESTPSTNREAKRIGEEGGAHGTLVVADEQTAGRGRRGRDWSSPKGNSIYMTLLLRPKLPPEKISMVTLVMGLAVAAAIRDTCGVEAGIKWPNDIVAEGRKLCGILTEVSAEMTAVSYVVIGVGINVNEESFPESIRDIAGSIRTVTGKKTDRAQLVAACMDRFESRYEAFEAQQDLTPLMEEYNSLLVNRGRRVRVLDQASPFEGTALGINASGELLVEREGGEVTPVYAGEVSVRGQAGYV